MRLKAYYDSIFSVPDIQFVFGVVLANAGYQKYATQLIEYETQKAYGLHADVESNPAMAKKLNESREQINRKIDLLAEEKNLNHDYAAIVWFFTQPILKEGSANAVHNKITRFSLQSKLGEAALKGFYSQIMQILLTTPSNALIIHYVASPLFKKPFRTAISHVINSRWPGRALSRMSDEDFELLRDDFRRIYTKGLSMNSHAFEPITGDPNSALCGVPVKLWYANNSTAQLGSVVKGRGQDIETDDGSVSLLNLKELNDETDTNDIDFIDICTKINKASYIIFSHKGHVPYDIFSHHCDRAMTPLVNSFIKECSQYYRCIKFDTSTDSIGACSGSTELGKIKTRCEYADYLDDRFARSVMAYDLQSIIDKLYEITSKIRSSDGCHLFAVDGIGVHINGSESERFESLMQGYEAMYELISYINRNEAKTGISIYDFPVIIFRDADYLKRFRTFDEYIHGYKAVEQLLNEIKDSKDTTRTAYKLNGFLANEYVDSYLSSAKSIKYIAEFAQLGDKLTTFAYVVTHKCTTVSVEEQMANAGLDLVHFLINPSNEGMFRGVYPHFKYQPASAYEQTMDQYDYLQSLNFLCSVAGNCTNFLPDDEHPVIDTAGPSSYFVAIQFLYILERVQRFEGYPIVDSGNLFCCSLPHVLSSIKEKRESLKSELQDLYSEIQASVDAQEKMGLQQQVEAKNQILNLLETALSSRVHGLLFVHNLFFRTQFKKSEFDKLEFDNIFNIYYVYSWIKPYLEKVFSIMYCIKPEMSDGKDATNSAIKKNIALSSFTTSASLVEFLPVLRVPDHISSLSEISFLCEGDFKSYTHPDMVKNAQYVIETSKRSSNTIITAFNYMLSTFSDVVGNLNTLADCVDIKTMSASKNANVESTVLQNTLKQLNDEITFDSFTSSDENLLNSKILASHATFTSYGFAQKDGHLICKEGPVSDVYYHKDGIACSVRHDSFVAEHHSMTDEDIQFIRRY